MFHPYLAAPTSVLLKAQTAEAHASLESLMLPSLQSVKTTADYAAVLQTFYGFFSPLESELEHYIYPFHLPDFAGRRKASFLIHDLMALGVDVSALPFANTLPCIETSAAAFGALYVMEGSTLGGRGIMRMLQKSLPDLPTTVLSFFNGYGEKTGPMWTAFQQALNNAVANEVAQAQAIETANETFIKFGQWMQRTT